MELTSAVRSVSCSSTINKKCNGSVSKEKSADREGCGSGNDGDDEEEYGTTTKKSVYTNNWQPQNGFGPPPGCSRPPLGPPSYRHVFCWIYF